MLSRLCRALPFPTRKEKDLGVGIDEQYLREMLDLQKHIKGDKEQIIGWYCSCSSDLFSLKTPHVHDFIQGITAELGIQPIYLAVDAGLSDMSVGTRAYYGTALELGGEALSAQFKEIRTNIVVEESEKVGLDAMIKQMGKARESSTVAKDIGNVEVSIRRLSGLLDVTAEYVSDVVWGKSNRMTT